MQKFTLSIPAASPTYAIYIGSDTLARVAELVDAAQYSSIFVITDENVAKIWLPALQKSLPEQHASITVPAGEAAKTLATVESIWATMHRAGCDRKTLVLTLGGGVIGDMGGFAASTYMRGVAFAHIPTSLLAQVDSSIGGKTGFDFAGLKNLIGTFAQPTAVLIDTTTLSTLSRRDLVAGFAEMLKHGLIRNAAYFRKLVGTDITTCSATQRAELIATSTHIKAEVVQSDETEGGLRKILNFGHTIGHAVEALSWQGDHPLLHGEAVAIGMVVEAELSQQLGYLSASDVRLIRQGIEQAGLPVTVPPLPLSAIMEKLQGDKKNEHGKVQFTLLESIGSAVYNQVINEKLVARTIQANMEEHHAD